MAGRGCDDAHNYRVRADGTLIIAAADGAGTAARSSDGANCVVAAALAATDYALDSIPVSANEPQWTEQARIVLAHSRASLEILADCVGGGLEELATTLLVAIVRNDCAVAIQVGDGAIVAGDWEGNFSAITWPRNYEYANETVFMTSNNYTHEAQISVAHLVLQFVAVFTDGLQLLALDMATRQPYAPFFAPMLRFGRSDEASQADLASFLSSARVCAATDDDKTLVIATSIEECTD
jgi:hypothetical protein